jgi:LacI family transcriptional regulator
MARVTMQDVAREAGFSVATVSRVLTGSRRVRPDVVRAVRAAQERLGYRTNQLASALRRQATGTVGMVVPQISNPFFTALVQAVERSLHRSGHGLLLCDGEESPEVEAERVRTLLARQVDGLLIVPYDAEQSAACVREAANEVPVVQLDRVVSGAKSDSVAVDNELGMAEMVHHLAIQGYQQLAFVGSQPTNSTAAERLRAYLAHAGARDEQNRHRVLLGDFSTAWGQKAGGDIVAGEMPAAIVCGNDLIALGVLDALLGHGLHVPDDIALAGFDDIAFATLIRPTLTSVRQPVDELGAEAVRTLLSRLSRKDGMPRKIRIQPEIVPRQSTGATTSASG